MCRFVDRFVRQPPIASERRSLMNTHATEALAAPRIETTRWRIDPTRSSVKFHVKGFWGMQTVKGHFARYHGTLDLAAQPAIELVIEADSLDTKQEARRAPALAGLLRRRTPSVRPLPVRQRDARR